MSLGKINANRIKAGPEKKRIVLNLSEDQSQSLFEMVKDRSDLKTVGTGIRKAFPEITREIIIQQLADHVASGMLHWHDDKRRWSNLAPLVKRLDDLEDQKQAVYKDLETLSQQMAAEIAHDPEFLKIIDAGAAKINLRLDRWWSDTRAETYIQPGKYTFAGYDLVMPEPKRSATPPCGAGPVEEGHYGKKEVFDGTESHGVMVVEIPDSKACPPGGFAREDEENPCDGGGMRPTE